MKSFNFGQLKKEENSNNKKRQGAAIAASVAALWLVFELVLFFVSMPNAPELAAKDVIINEAGENGYDINESVTLKFKDACGKIDSISFEAVADAGQDPINVMTVKVWGVDPATSGQVIYKTEEYFVGKENGAKKILRMDIPASASGLRINFSHNGFNYNVTDIKINSKSDASFNFSRTLIVFIIIAIVWACKHFELWSKFFDPKKHGKVALLICLVCVVIATVMASVTNGYRENDKYPLEANAIYYNPYVQQFDAFMKGQLHLDIEPSKELLDLENPYDPAARDGVPYLWDRAFYEGKYYSYFGTGPIFALYYPYYFLTGGLPSENTVMLIFTIMTALFFSLAAFKWAAMYTKKLPLPLLVLGIVSALFSTQIFLVMRGRASFYYIATAAGMAFLAMFMWLFLCGISGSFRFGGAKKENPYMSRPKIFALAGIAYGFCFLSRFNIALFAAFIIVPMLWFCVVREKKAENGECKTVFRPMGQIIPELAALAIPVIIAIGFQLCLNYLRFDSFFEFGTTYQLTVSDVSRNKLRLSDLPSAVYHYFLQPLSVGSDYPVVSLFPIVIGNYGHYVYVDTGMGLFSIPLMWGLLGSVGIFANKKRSLFSKLLLAALLVGAVVVALFDFCLGGVIFRYTCDLTLLCAFGAMAVVFALYEDLCDGGTETACRTANVISCTVFVLSLAVSLSLAFSLNGNLVAYEPSVYIWWRSIFGM